MKITLVFTVLLFAATANANHIQGFSLKKCVAETCFELTTPTAQRGNFEGLFAFAQARLDLRKTKKDGHQLIKSIHANDGYYDPELEHLVLRHSNDGKKKEIVVSLKSGQVFYF